MVMSLHMVMSLQFFGDFPAPTILVMSLQFLVMSLHLVNSLPSVPVRSFLVLGLGLGVRVRG